MRHSKFGLRAFGLALVAALGLMAFSAVAAQAENLTDGGKEALFEILKSGPLVGTETFTGTIENWTDGLKHGFLLVPALKLSILCGNLTFDPATKFLNDKEALVKIRFLECEAFNLEGTEKLTTCIVTSKAEGGEKGVILSEGIALPKKHETESYLLFHPHTGLAFATIFFEKEKGCPLTLKNEVKGLFDALLKEKEAIEHLITSNKAIQELMLGGVKLKFGAQEAIIDGNVKEVKLTGAHSGCAFGVV